MAELKAKQQRKLTESSGSSNAPESVPSPAARASTAAAPVITPRPPKDIVSPTSATAAPIIAPRPSKDAATPTPVSAAPALAPRPAKDITSPGFTKPIKDEAKAPQLPPKGGDKLQAELKASLPSGNSTPLKPAVTSKESTPEPESEGNAAIPPWKLEMEKRKQQKAAQVQL